MSQLKKLKESLKDSINYLFFCEYRFRRTVRRHLRKYYTPDAPRAANARRQIIVMFDGRYPHHGFADRLRGIVTLYAYCKEHDLDFRIHFTSPFRLEEYLEPAAYNWRISEQQLCYNEQDAAAVFIDAYRPGSEREMDFQRRLTHKFLSQPYRQLHVYTNIFYAERQFGELFHELFRPTAALQRQADKHIAQLGGEEGYIAISTRFLELLGDFNERRDRPARGLPAPQQQELMARCCAQIVAIRDAHPEATAVLVTSDSTRFLERASQIEKVRILPGEIGHMDVVGSERHDVHSKTLLDFLVLGHAAEVDLLVTGGMYRSNFSRRAAQLHDRPFYEVFF